MFSDLIDSKISINRNKFRVELKLKMEYNCDCFSFEKCFEKRMEKTLMCFRGYDVCGNEICNPYLHKGDAMRYEVLRLDTFDDWPKADIVPPSLLAKNGFYYVGRNDGVSCAFCDVFLCDWKEGDQPSVEHRKASFNCPLINRGYTDNVEADIQRVVTFEQLCDSGIFTDRKNGVVKCKFCEYSFDKSNREWSDVQSDHYYWSFYCPVNKSFPKFGEKIEEFLGERMKKEEVELEESPLMVIHKLKVDLEILYVDKVFRNSKSAKHLIDNFESWYEGTKKIFEKFEKVEQREEKTWTNDVFWDMVAIIDVFWRKAREDCEESGLYRKRLYTLFKLIQSIYKK